MEFHNYLPGILSILIPTLILGLIIKYRYPINRVVRRNVYVKLGLIFVVLFVIGTLGMYFFERRVNENFMDIYQSFWSSMVYLLSGFEDRAPVTTHGRIMSIFIFIASICIIGSVAGKFASIFIERGEVKMPKEVKEHIAICNWNEGGDRIVKELHNPEAKPETEIIIVTDKEINEVELRKNKAYEKVFFIKSDPTLHDVLKTSRVHLAKSVLILADKKSPDTDANSALIALAVIKLCNTGPRPHIVAEAINHRKIEHLKDAGVDEVICATDYGLGILAQCALYTKLSTVYDNLLTYSEDTNEIYIVAGDKLPNAIIGKTFKETAEMLNKNRDPVNPAILIGVRRGDRIILNPKEKWTGQKGKKFERFEEGDNLIVIAFNIPNLSDIN